jgi:hypothetical protein
MTFTCLLRATSTIDPYLYYATWFLNEERFRREKISMANFCSPCFDCEHPCSSNLLLGISNNWKKQPDARPGLADL